MVDIRNIKWNGKCAVADLYEDGSKEIAYTIEVDENIQGLFIEQ